MSIDLPISKSIANRLLILQALHGEPLLSVDSPDMPDDVRVLRRALTEIAAGGSRIDVSNCGTAMRFLTAYCAQLRGRSIILDGDKRMRHRPMEQLVNALNACGADIWYEGEYGFPPLRIHGKSLSVPVSGEDAKRFIAINNPESTQFVSAMLLVGLETHSDSRSPYILMTRQVLQRYAEHKTVDLERDWSAAAFWYEYVALHGGSLHLNGLRRDSVQGDAVLADIFRSFGVSSYFDTTGVTITRDRACRRYPRILSFRNVPDLYPSIAILCRQLRIPLWALHTDALRLKESDRMQSVREQKTYSDHRVAMALMVAGLPCDDPHCCSKSYPCFPEHLKAVKEDIPMTLER